MAEVCLGPMTLREALAHGGPSTVKMAETMPDGDYVAVMTDVASFGCNVWIRRKHKRSGWSASVADTGEWVAGIDVPPNLSWRPI